MNKLLSITLITASLLTASTCFTVATVMAIMEGDCEN